MPGALEGIRVLDCTQIIAGPLGASLLADMGADVVKIEPLEGEPWRLQAEIAPKESRGYLVHNRGKRGIAIDLKHPAADFVRRKLIAWADVLMTNYRPGVPELLKVDYASAKEIRPDIIYCEGTAFGKQGPYAQLRGYDIIAQSMSGLTALNQHINDRGMPQPMAFAPADVITGTVMAWAVTAALFHRLRTGEGQAINASLFHTALWVQGAAQEIPALDAGPRQQRLDHLDAARARGADITEIYAERRKLMPELSGNIYYRHYKTKDNYIAVGCLGPAPRERFRSSLGIHDARYDPGFTGSAAEVGEALVEQCEAIFLTRSSDEWLGYLQQADVACGPFRFLDELRDDPQVVANGYLTEYEHPLFGTLRGTAPVATMHGSPTRIQRGSPMLGEHTDEVMAELGIDAATIARLRECRAIG
jgi:formyl-CoA transferase